MEYIAKANCGVDSSFLTDGFRTLIEFLFLFFFVFFKRPGSLLYVKVCFLSTVNAALESLRIFETYKRSYYFSWLGIYKNKLNLWHYKWWSKTSGNS